MHQLVNHALRKGTDPRKILFLSLDNPLFQFPTLRRLIDHAAICAEVSASDFQFMFLDEVQYTHDWARWLKTLVQEPIRRRIVVTGSAAATIGRRGPDEGVGRWVDVHVPTLNLVEFAVLRGQAVKPPSHPLELMEAKPPDSIGDAERDVLRTEFSEYLLRGGYPELAQRRISVETAQRMLAEDVAEKVLNRDMAALYNVRRLLSLRQIFTAIAYRTSNIIDRAKLANDFRVSAPTVGQFLKYLELAFLVRSSLRYSPSDNRVVKSHPKFYVTDPGLRNAVTRRDARVLENEVEMGAIVETAVFNQVFEWARTNLATVYYWRGQPSDREVDIVVRAGDGVLIPVEVKYQTQIRPEDLHGLSAFIAKYPDRVKTAYLIVRETGTDALFRVGGCNVVQMPAYEFIWRLAWAATDPRVADYIRQMPILADHGELKVMTPERPGSTSGGRTEV